METNIGENLALIRKEKKISQKEAASRLGISQALLSHYENGVRECGLDFVRRASRYYGVTSDWLLGLEDARHSIHDLYSQEPQETDDEMSLHTALRALAQLSEQLQTAGDFPGQDVLTLLAVDAYRLALYGAIYGVADENWFSLEVGEANALSNEVSRAIVQYPDRASSHEGPEPTAAMRTVLQEAEKRIREHFNDVLNPS